VKEKKEALEIGYKKRAWVSQPEIKKERKHTGKRLITSSGS